MVSILSVGEFVMLNKVNAHVRLREYEQEKMVFSVYYYKDSTEAG
jgi:hypothetical protein